MLLFFIHCFSTSSLTLPWTIAKFLNPFYTFSPAHRRVIRDTFILTFPRSSFTVLPRALRFWVGILYPQAFFTLCCFTDILPALIKGFPGSRQFFDEVCRASCWSSNHRPSSSVCLIRSNSQFSYSEEFIFKYYQTLSWITGGESLIYLLLTCYELFSLVQSICKDIKKHFEQDLLLFITASMNIKVIFKKQPPEKSQASYKIINVFEA